MVTYCSFTIVVRCAGYYNNIVMYTNIAFEKPAELGQWNSFKEKIK
jgi:hypothetical protein